MSSSDTKGSAVYLQQKGCWNSILILESWEQPSQVWLHFLPMAPAGRILQNNLSPVPYMGFISEGNEDRIESQNMSYPQLSYKLKLPQVTCVLLKCWTKKSQKFGLKRKEES